MDKSVTDDDNLHNNKTNENNENQINLNMLKNKDIDDDDKENDNLNAVTESVDKNHEINKMNTVLNFKENVTEDLNDTAALLKEQMEEKRVSEEKFKNEQQENAYKRLMHLLTQSKFYNDFLTKKIQGDETTSKEQQEHEENNKKSVTRSSSRLASKNKNDNSNKRKKNNDDNDEDYKPNNKRTKKINKSKKLNKIVNPELKKKIKEKLDNTLSDNENLDDEKNNIIQDNGFIQPEYLTAELRDYQKIGLRWLIALYENGLSGILADEMGLGKTVQSIALICYLLEKKIPGPYLVIAPLSTITNWETELINFAPNVPFVILHGKPEERQKQIKKIRKKYTISNGFQSLPVVITTYEVVVQEKTIICQQKWRYIIIDEGQRIKNSNCLLFKVLTKCTSMNRLLLTGTPLQNNMCELWSLLNFLMPELFDDLDVFESWFNAKDLLNKNGTDKLLEQEKDKQIVAHLREILKPFMLRRLKTDVCPDIPPKKEVIIYAPMTDIQRQLYTAILNRDISKYRCINPVKLIIDDENGCRPKRKCTMKNKFSTNYQNIQRTLSNNSTKSSSSSSSSVSNDDWKPDMLKLFTENCNNTNELNEMKQLNCKTNDDLILDIPNFDKLENIWGEHATITPENAYYFTKLTYGHRLTLYKQIVNHPYLVNGPIHAGNMPIVNQELINVSGKFLVLDALLKKLYEQKHKVLIFSTFTSILDYIEIYLQMRPWKWTRLDGSYKIDDRQHNINLFNNDPNVFLFLITTRAGGVGLNLMGADTVIIFDSDWNPQADIQAMARCHRIGQKRPVIIYKLCTKGSYDELIVNRGVAKRKLEKLVISKDLNSTSFDKDMLLAMQQLLEKTEHEVVNSEQAIFTDEELNKLTDRGDLIKEMNDNQKNIQSELLKTEEKKEE